MKYVFSTDNGEGMVSRKEAEAMLETARESAFHDGWWSVCGPQVPEHFLAVVRRLYRTSDALADQIAEFGVVVDSETYDAWQKAVDEMGGIFVGIDAAHPEVAHAP